MREKRDILLVMSDQHCDVREVFGGLLKPSDTPAMEKLTREGARYDHCYASAPLCVPSRMSFLTGRLPSELDIFNNDCVLPSDVPTIAHEMGILGYHTVLCGRMHFKGEDQHHGFDERLCGDITSQYWGTGEKNGLILELTQVQPIGCIVWRRWEPGFRRSMFMMNWYVGRPSVILNNGKNREKSVHRYFLLLAFMALIFRMCVRSHCF